MSAYLEIYCQKLNFHISNHFEYPETNSVVKNCETFSTLLKREREREITFTKSFFSALLGYPGNIRFYSQSVSPGSFLFV